jgi:UDP-glucose 4-epimerase
VVSIDRKSRPPLPGEEFVCGDLTDPGLYERLSPAKVVYHLAAQSSARVSLETPFEELRDNIVATVRLLEHCRETKVQKVVFTSSMGVYGEAADGESLSEDSPLRPTSLYGADKLAAEAYLRVYQQFGLAFTIFRLFNVYGPYQDMDNLKQGMVSIYLRYIHDGVEVPVTGALTRYRDFVFVYDVIDALELALREPATDNETFNVGTGHRTTVRELIDMVAAQYGYAPGTYPVRVVGTHAGDVAGSVASIAKLALLGWSPRYGLTAGLGEMVGWLRRPGPVA